MLKFFRTCKSKSYLKAFLMIIEKVLFMSRRRLDCLKLFLYKGIHLRKIKARVKSCGYQIKEKTLPDDLINKHEVEPTKVEDAFQDESWVEAMHAEFHQFQGNDAWTLVPRPKGVNIIGIKWIFHNKIDEEGNVIRNKARLVAQGYTQVEGVDFDETLVPIARIESIRVLLAFACHLKFKLYEMDMKSAFLNGFLEEEVSVAQPKGFIDPHFPDHVLYLKKTFYGLKQASKAWYDRLTEYLVPNGFIKG